MDILKQGERGLIVGQTGSGKTVGAIHHLRMVPGQVIIIDTKIEPEFDRIALHKDEISLSVDSRPAMRKAIEKDFDYLIVRPKIEDLLDPTLLDEYLLDLYYLARGKTVYVDETYMFHRGTQAGPGAVGLLTRGRSKGITLLSGSQRPAWISRFFLTEAQRYYVYQLADKQDKKRLTDVIPDFLTLDSPPKFSYHYYDRGLSGAQLKRPVPLLEPEKEAPEVGDRFITVRLFKALERKE
jgi:ABC-type dipeptide/oligopeptide/nickel transport system ATPase component